MRRWQQWRARFVRRADPARTHAAVGPLLAGAATVFVCVVLLTGWLLWDARRLAWEHAAQSSANVVATIEQDIAHTIAIYDLSLQAVVNGLKLPGIDALSPAMRNEVLFDHAAEARFLGAIEVLDATGRLTIDSRRTTPPANMNFADRAFFRVHRDDPQRGLYIGAPFRDPQTGAWSVTLSRRLEHKDGSFAGVVVGTLSLDFFGHLFSLIDPGGQGAVALFRTDGTLVDRRPYREDLVGRQFADFALFSNYPRAAAGMFHAKSAIDGTMRLYAYRQVGNLPLVLALGTANESVVGPWRQKAIGIAIAIAALSGIVAILGLALLRELRYRALAQRTARDSERRYRLLAEHSFDMIVRFDPRTQRRTYISPACRRLYGYEPQEALALSAAEVIHPDDFPGVCRALVRLEQGSEHAPIVYRGRRKDGSYVWVEASLTPAFDPETGAAEVVSVVRDVSERIRYEAALRHAKEEADSANRCKSEFLATMSHELRTPLTAIIGFAQLMRGEVKGPIRNDHYRSYIEDINVSGTHLLELINDVLDLSKAEAGLLELREDVIDLGGAIRAVARACRAPIEKAGLTLDIELAANLPPLRGDERKTRQVFFNLIGNAVKFTPAGGHIRISGGFDRQTGTRITVADTGIGIAAADLDRVLQPFVQLDNSLARQHQGTGLGLPAVKAIMELHGGSVELKSAPDGGTEVTVVFPPERAVPFAEPEAAARSAA